MECLLKMKFYDSQMKGELQLEQLLHTNEILLREHKALNITAQAAKYVTYHFKIFMEKLEVIISNSKVKCSTLEGHPAESVSAFALSNPCASFWPRKPEAPVIVIFIIFLSSGF